MEDIAAHNLLNRTLQEGWRVVEKKEKKAGDTGGTFSVCYIVEKEGKKYFMKAFNVNGFMGHRTKRILRIERKEYQTY